MISVAYGRSLFAYVGVEYFHGATEEDCEIDFSLMKASDWKDGDFSGTCPLNENDNLIVALKKGILIACKELGIKNILIQITSHKFVLVDASELGFTTAGYQVVYKAIKGKEKYPKITKEVLEEMQGKL